MSLMDNVEIPDKTNANNVPTKTEEQNNVPQNINHMQGEGLPENNPWFYDENKPGEGNRPEWLKEKYKSAAEQAKAYVELEKKMGAFKGAPEDYDVALSDYPEAEFNKEDPFLKDFIEDAKKNNVSQEYFSHLLNTYVKMQKMMMPDPDKELEKLGANAEHDIQILAQWGSNVLTKDEFSTFKNMMTTAESVRIFEKLRALTSSPDTQPKGSNMPKETEEDVRKLIHDPRFDTDETFRNEVREKLKRFGS